MKIFVLLLIAFHISVKDSTDKIILRNGETINAKVLEVSDNHIIFLEDTIQKIKSIKVEKIVFKSGKEVIISGKLPQINVYERILFGLIFPIFGFFNFFYALKYYNKSNKLIERDKEMTHLLLFTSIFTICLLFLLVLINLVNSML